MSLDRERRRSTQGFAYTMAAVWKRPGVTGLELAWRWVAGLPLIVAVVLWAMRVGPALPVDVGALEGMTFFRPVPAVEALSNAFYAVLPAVRGFLVWFVPSALVWWTLLGAVGRGLVGRRLDGRQGWPCGRAVMALFWLGLLRVVGVWATLALWLAAMLWGAHVAIAGPVVRGGEPNVVGYMAIVIVSSLVLFTAWAVVSWPLVLAQLVTIREGVGVWASLRVAAGARELRGPLAEISLVLCIVRIALLVLGLVFSACPLPFQSVETQGFLLTWWTGVTVLYLVMSDYFHVVRVAATVQMVDAFAPETAAPASETAS